MAETGSKRAPSFSELAGSGLEVGGGSAEGKNSSPGGYLRDKRLASVSRFLTRS
jgi:hypothetical protein